MNRLLSGIWKAAYAFRPFVKKILPIRLLRKIKADFIQKNTMNLKIKPHDFSKFPIGFNLIGEIRAPHSMGQSCRLLAKEIEASGLGYMLYQYENGAKQESISDEMENRLGDELEFCVNIFHIPPYEFGKALIQLRSSILDYRYNIVFWLWELEQFPDEWAKQIKNVDEIWTPSEFVSESIRKVTNKTVRTIPYAIDVPVDEKYDRNYFHLKEDLFLFLIMYDSSSLLARKNPVAAIKAFKLAFSKDNKDVGLVIKISNANRKELHLIRQELEGYENIYIIAEVMQKQEVNSLILCMDVLVSLHRAEGFGLILAEAMKLGVPVIATNWSANAEFMNKDTACMVDYKLVKLEKTCEFYEKGQRWAEGNVEQAACYMRNLFQDNSYYTNISEKGKQHIDEVLSLKVAGERINDIMVQILNNESKLEL